MMSAASTTQRSMETISMWQRMGGGSWDEAFWGSGDILGVGREARWVEFGSTRSRDSMESFSSFHRGSIRALITESSYTEVVVILQTHTASGCLVLYIGLGL